MILSTVWHTGTAYMLQRLPPETRSIHCSPAIWDYRDDGFITTSRDPYLVGASWGNRYDMRHREIERVWFEQWEWWKKILSFAEIFYVRDFDGEKFGDRPDKNGLHKALSDNDMDYYYSLVPKGYIEFAL